MYIDVAIHGFLPDCAHVAAPDGPRRPRAVMPRRALSGARVRGQRDARISKSHTTLVLACGVAICTRLPRLSLPSRLNLPDTTSPSQQPMEEVEQLLV